MVGAINFNPTRGTTDLVVADQIRAYPVPQGCSHMRAFLSDRRKHRLVDPLEREGLASVGFELEADELHGLKHLVVDRTD